jgi:hypothetical protein
MIKNNQNLDKQNQVVYLTESSYRQLVNSSDTQTFDLKNVKANLNQIYDNWKFYKMFNRGDFKFLYKSYLLISGETGSVFYKEVEDRKDNLDYILELKGKLKYHLNPNCERLNSGFRNFFVPEPIATIIEDEKRKELVNEIRNWFKINNYTIEKYNSGEITDKMLTEAFNNFFASKFNIEKIVISQSDNNQFKWYTEKSTNAVKIEYEFNMDNFICSVNKIVSDRNKLCKISNPLYNLSKYDYLHSKNHEEIISVLNESISNGYLKEVTENYINQLGLENLITFWKQHLEIKLRAKKEFLELLKWKFNLREFGLKNINLEDFNFECCAVCREGGNKTNMDF